MNVHLAQLLPEQGLNAHLGPRVTDSLKILLVTDAWPPQINGVVRTLKSLAAELLRLGHRVRFITPEKHRTVPLPTYPEIRLALFPRKSIQREIEAFAPDAIHIATEGTMGLCARAICRERGLPFTTSFHTRYPDYVGVRFPFIPQRAVYGLLKTFHAPAAATMVSTASLRRELEHHGFANISLWLRGVDTDLFKPLRSPERHRLRQKWPEPIFLYVGRLAVEKNIEAFLSLDLPGTKLVVGEGPHRAELEACFPEAHFLGPRAEAELADIYAASDVFVFPSRTDTFGLVLLESLACGTPVAAFPEQAPREVLGREPIAIMNEDLRAACLRALLLSRKACRDFALTRSWQASAAQFLDNLAPIGRRTG